MAAWHVLGFTHDDVVTAEQDARLAFACLRAWTEAGRPDGFAVRARGGDGAHLIFWYVSDGAARVLDGAEPEWRRFLVGACDAPPEGAFDPLELGGR